MIESFEKYEGKTEIRVDDAVLPLKKPMFIKSTKIRKGSRRLSSAEIKLIKKIISLFKTVKKEEDHLRQKAGLQKGVINFSEDHRAWSEFISAPKPKRNEFQKFIESLSDNELALIEVVMYGGRDASSAIGRAHPLEEMLEQFSDDSRESRLYAITTKGALDIYLTAGIKAYK